MPRFRSATVVAVIALPLLVGCTDGGIKVGPFPVSFAVGDGTLEPAELEVEPGKFGVQTIELPLCSLPTRAEVDEMVAASMDGGLAADFELTELLVDDFVFTANQGTFTGLTSVSVFIVPAGRPPTLLGAIPLGTALAPDIAPQEFALEPPNAVDVLDVIPQAAGGDCATLLLVVSGITPGSPIAWQGDLFADAFGVVRFDF